MIGLYDRDGRPLTLLEWGALSRDDVYKLVAEDLVVDEQGNVTTVSTVWLGIDHSFGMGGPPIIFETMLFSEDPRLDCWQRRYPTEAMARAGHDRALAELRDHAL